MHYTSCYPNRKQMTHLKQDNSRRVDYIGTFSRSVEIGMPQETVHVPETLSRQCYQLVCRNMWDTDSRAGNSSRTQRNQVLVLVRLLQRTRVNRMCVCVCVCVCTRAHTRMHESIYLPIHVYLYDCGEICFKELTYMIMEAQQVQNMQGRLADWRSMEKLWFKSKGILLAECLLLLGRLKSVKVLVVSDSLRPCGLLPARLFCPWNSPGKNSGVSCHPLLQRIFPTQGSNSGLLHCRQVLYCLRHQ